MANVGRYGEGATPGTAARAPCDEPIAVIGLACRFPGAPDAPAYWRLLRDGRDAVGEVPADRFDVGAVFDPDPAAPGKAVTRRGGFLEGVDRFDAAFFGVSPREAAQVDPQQRIMLELSFAALEDAGQPLASLRNSRTGVYVGAMWTDYARLASTALEGIEQHTATGQDTCVISGRISYALGLRGPSMTVNTACSSSLVAVHLACKSLRDGECALALAGGVSLMLTPHILVEMSKFGGLSPDGRCKAFDARADGYVRAEGAGVVVLKPLARALADGDAVYCVIVGSAVNNDGACDGLTVPDREAQEMVLREACARAGVDPRRVHYVEAHGTGTAAGDPVEASALGAVYGAGRAPERPLVIGSVKTNIGHPEPAAGVAGLIKVALALHHRQIPASLHFERPHPSLDFEALGLSVGRALTSWPHPEERPLAGVSAFGFSGTNCHVVVEGHAPAAAPDPPEEAELLLLSARGPAALRDLAERTARFLDEDAGASLHDLCFTAALRRTHHDHRLALVARSTADAREQLAAHFAGAAPPGLVSGRAAGRRPRVFVFPGQGGQWCGMGRRLLETSAAFRATVERCDAAMAPTLGWSMVDELRAGAPTRDTVDVIQPVLFVFQVALAAAFGALGVAPAAVLGHSMGESAASAVSGALAVEDAARIIAVRSRLMRRFSGRGAMLHAELPEAQARAAIAPWADRLSVGVVNGPRAAVLSGDVAAVAELEAALAARGVFTRRIKVDVAAHSPQMDEIADELAAALAGLVPRPSAIPYYSTVTGDQLDGARLDAAYWMRNLREPVRFLDAARRVLAKGDVDFVEISPHPALASALGDALRESRRAGVVVSPLRRGDDEAAALLRGLGELYVAGDPGRLSALHPSGGRPLRLPSYPFQRERFWLATPAPAPAPGGRHPLLGAHLPSSLDEHTHLFALRLDGATALGLDAHRLHGQSVLPASACMELVLAAVEVVEGDRARAVEDVAFVEAVPLSEGAAVEAQLALIGAGGGAYQFRVATRRIAGARGAGPWSPCVTGTVRPADEAQPSAAAWPSVARPRAASVRAQRLASGFDAALALLVEALFPDGDACVLAAVTRLAVHLDPGEAPQVEARVVSAADRTGDVRLRDAHGRVAVEALGLRFCALPPRAEALIHAVAWQRAALPGADGRRHRWLIVDSAPDGEARATAPALARALEARGDACVRVVAGAALDEVVAGHDGLVYVGGAAADWEQGCASLLHAAQALARAARPARLHLVTLRGRTVGDETDAAALSQAPLWGLGRAVGAEHAALRFRGIDLGSLTPSDLDLAARLLGADEAAEEVAIRAGAPYTPHFAPWIADVEGPAPPVRAEGTYLVTGGSGAVASRLGRWLAERGAGHVVLASRGTGGDEARDTRASMARAGAQVRAVRADVSTEAGVAALLAALADLPPLRGVIHAAAAVDDGPLLEQDAARFGAVLAPKAMGAWHLHRATADRPLDFFVLCSSIAGAVGIPGQGAYGAANAFLDALAHHRRALGLPALSVGWGGWAGIGLAATASGAGSLKLLSARGIGAFSADAGVKALEILLASRPPPYVAVAPIDPARLAERPSPRAGGASFREALAAARPPSRQRGLLEDHVREQAARVLRAPPQSVDHRTPLRALGLDSLMAVELRGQLEGSLGVPLSTTLLWQKPTVAELALHLGDLLGLGDAAPAAPDAGDDEALSALLAELDGLSDDASKTHAHDLGSAT